MTVFGHGRKRMDFTVIAQPWLRNAAKHWVLEELPVRRGLNIVDGLRDHVNSVGGSSADLQVIKRKVNPRRILADKCNRQR